MIMSPASKEEWGTIKECAAKIKYLEETVKELRQELRTQRQEKIESKRRISDRRLGFYIAVASIIGYIACEVVKWLASL